MAPEIQEGDRVIVDCSEAAREAPDGLPMAVRLTGGEDVVVKRLYRRRDAAGRLVELTLEDNHGQRALAGPELNEVEIVGRILQVNKPIESVMARRAARRTPRRDQ